MNDKEINIALGKLFNGLELKGERVELGLVEDFEKVFEAAIDKDAKIGVGLIDDLRKAEVAYKKVEDDYAKAIKIGEKVKKAVKDLGVDLPKEVSNKIQSSEAGVKEVRKIVGKIKSMYNIF